MIKLSCTKIQNIKQIVTSIFILLQRLQHILKHIIVSFLLDPLLSRNPQHARASLFLDYCPDASVHFALRFWNIIIDGLPIFVKGKSTVGDFIGNAGDEIVHNYIIVEGFGGHWVFGDRSDLFLHCFGQPAGRTHIFLGKVVREL